MDSIALVFLPVFINRITEQLKLSVINPLGLKDEQQKALILFTSLLLGALGVVFVFPSFNLIQGQGASLLAEQIVTGVIVGGLANGIDFLAKTGTTALDKIAPAE